jgi:hypothetical protein
MLNVIKLNVVIPSVVAPQIRLGKVWVNGYEWLEIQLDNRDLKISLKYMSVWGKLYKTFYFVIDSPE